jgi:copper chaperone CopZ
MKSLRVKIEGMHCDGCATMIEALLAHQPGVKATSVSHAGGGGRILYDPGATDPGRLVAAIEKAGYRVAIERHEAG